MKFLVLCILGMAQTASANVEWFFQTNDETIPATEKANSIEIISEPEEGKIHNFELYVDDQYNLEGFIRSSESGTQEIPFDEMNGKDIVLAEVKDMEALKLRCDNCTREQGGKVILTYLYNGLLPSYREFHMELKRTGPQTWELHDSAGESIQVLYLVSRILMGYLIGIDKILVNPTDEEINPDSQPDTQGHMPGIQVPLRFPKTNYPTLNPYRGS